MHTITADRVVGGFTGQSERQLREAFAEAEDKAAAGKRVVHFSSLLTRMDNGPTIRKLAVMQMVA